MGPFNNHVDKRRGVGGQSNVHEFPLWVLGWSMKSPRGKKHNQCIFKSWRKYNIQTILDPLKLLEFIKIHLTKAVSCLNLVVK